MADTARRVTAKASVDTPMQGDLRRCRHPTQPCLQGPLGPSLRAPAGPERASEQARRDGLGWGRQTSPGQLLWGVGGGLACGGH